MKLGRLLSGPEIALIVAVHAVGNRVEAAALSKMFHDLEKFVFALETALPVVARVVRTVEFRSRNHLDWNSLLSGEGQRIGKLRACETRRISNDRQHAISENAVSSPCEIRRIDAARISDENPPQSAELCL